MRGTRIGRAGVAVAVGLTLTACAPNTTATRTPDSPSSPASAVVRLSVVKDVFSPASWSASSAKGLSSPPLVVGDRAVVAGGSGISGFDAKGKEQWHTTVDLLPNSTNPNGVRTVIVASPSVIAVIDQGTLEGSTSGTRVTLLGVEDGQRIAAQSIPGDQIQRTTGLAFTVTTGSTTSYVAVSPKTGQKITTTDGKLPLATVGDNVIWGVPYSGNMGVQSAVTTGLPLENSTVQASDGQGVVVLSNQDATAWVNLATGKVLAPDSSCTHPPAPQALHASPSGSYVVGGNAIADVTKGTITCTVTPAVTWDAVTDKGVAYGRTTDAPRSLVVAALGVTPKTYPMPTDGAQTFVLGFTTGGTAVLFDPTSGIVNGNPVK
jgi:hypothetical protein